MSKETSAKAHPRTAVTTIDEAGDAVADAPCDDARMARVFRVPCAGLCASAALNPTMSVDAKLRDWASVTSALATRRRGA
jgi:hypothetical protein